MTRPHTRCHAPLWVGDGYGARRRSRTGRRGSLSWARCRTSRHISGSNREKRKLVPCITYGDRKRKPFLSRPLPDPMRASRCSKPPPRTQGESSTALSPFLKEKYLQAPKGKVPVSATPPPSPLLSPTLPPDTPVTSLTPSVSSNLRLPAPVLWLPGAGSACVAPTHARSPLPYPTPSLSREDGPAPLPPFGTAPSPTPSRRETRAWGLLLQPWRLPGHPPVGKGGVLYFWIKNDPPDRRPVQS